MNAGTLHHLARRRKGARPVRAFLTEPDPIGAISWVGQAVYPDRWANVPSRSSKLSGHAGRIIMLRRSSTGVVALAALMVTIGGARAAGEAKYPNWKGQWDVDSVTIMVR
jgi:hypothetical protein